MYSVLFIVVAAASICLPSLLEARASSAFTAGGSIVARRTSRCAKHPVLSDAGARVHRRPGRAVHTTGHIIEAAGLAFNPVVGGALAGTFHAISGPDHLAGLVAPSVGRPASTGLFVGAVWGLGHALSTLALGAAAFALKTRFAADAAWTATLAKYSPAAVGISLVMIGAFGLMDSTEHAHAAGSQSDPPKKLLLMPLSLILVNGILHGLSLDGAASLAPSLALGTWSTALLFLGSYSLGSAAVMSLAAGLISALSNRWVSPQDGDRGSSEGGDHTTAVRSHVAPAELARYSSYLAILVGSYWILSAGLQSLK